MWRRSAQSRASQALDGERRRWRAGSSSAQQVCFYAAGRRRGRPLVLVHDLRTTSNAREMRPLFESFRWRRPTFAVDLPGFGLSEPAALAHSQSHLATVLAEFLRRLRGLDLGMDAVALGRGSEVIARVARDEPRLFRSLVLLEPPGLLVPRRAALDSLCARLCRRLGEPAARVLVACLSPLTAITDWPDSVETASLYCALTVPVLVVHDSPVARSGALSAFLQGRANRYAVRVSPARGMPHFERRAETVAALDRFWQALSA